MKKLFLYTTCLISLSACHTKTDKPVTDSVATYIVPDDKAITKAIHAAYTSISFKNGETPDYEAIKTHFIPQAQVINYNTDTAQITTIEKFVYLYRSHVEADSVQSYSEREIFGKTEQFGKIAERISTYTAITGTLKGNNSERGVNSFQLIKTPSGWKISGVIWDIEKPGLKVPEYYLKK